MRQRRYGRIEDGIPVPSKCPRCNKRSIGVKTNQWGDKFILCHNEDCVRLVREYLAEMVSCHSRKCNGEIQIHYCVQGQKKNDARIYRCVGCGREGREQLVGANYFMGPGAGPDMGRGRPEGWRKR